MAPRRLPARWSTTAAGATLLSALLCGCTSDGQFPSLAKRPAELVAEGRIARSALPATPLPPAVQGLSLPLPADLPGRVAALGEAGRGARRRFEERRGAAQRAVAAAAGAAPASDAWSRATVALADLSAARSETAVPLAELDQLYVAQRVDRRGWGGRTARPPPRAPSVGAGVCGCPPPPVRDQVTAWVADEDAVLAGLEGRLKN